MNAQPTASKDDNLSKKFDAFTSHLDAIEKFVLHSQQHLTIHNEAVFDALGRTLDLGYQFADYAEKNSDTNWDFFKDFLQAFGDRWNAKCEVSFFHGLVSVAFNQIDTKSGNPINSAPTLSRYRAVLRFAYETGLDGVSLVSTLKLETLDGYYKKAVSHFRYDPLDKYIEDDDVRFLRSVRHLQNKRQMPKISYCDEVSKPKSVSGFATAVVRVRNNAMQIVGFTDDAIGDEQTMRAKVSSLVPAEARRRRKKLADKKLYWLYVTCDLYSRFLPKIADRRAWTKAIREAGAPIVDDLSSEEELEALIAHYVKVGKARANRHTAVADALDMQKNPTVLMKKFSFLDALEFFNENNTWHARTLSTHPNTPCLQATLPKSAPLAVTGLTIAMRGLEATKFVDEFPRYAEWSYKNENQKGTLFDSRGNAASMRLVDLRQLTNWRTINPNMKGVARYKLDRNRLHALEFWKAEYAEIPRIGRKAFPSIMKLDPRGGELFLSHPHNSDHIKSLGMLMSDTAPEFEAPRFFDFKNCETLIRLALDYGTDFEFEVMDGLEGLSALRVHPVDFPVEAAVTLPLMLSHKGNPAEITVGAQ